MHQADLVLVMGTSLGVQPVASLHTRAGGSVPRVLINRELVGNFTALRPPRGVAERGQGTRARESDKGSAVDVLASGLAAARLSESGEEKGEEHGGESDGEAEERYTARDAYFLGDTDEAVRRLAGMLGWGEELEEAVRRGRAGLRREWGLKEEAEEEEEELESKAEVEETRSALPIPVAAHSAAVDRARAVVAPREAADDVVRAVQSVGTIERATAGLASGRGAGLADGVDVAGEAESASDSDTDTDTSDDDDLVPAEQVERMSAFLAAQMKRASAEEEAG
jgi:hypothetical protein